MGRLSRVDFNSSSVWSFVKTTKKEQVGDLLDDLDGIGDPSGPEGVPDSVDLVSYFPGQHSVSDPRKGRSRMNG